MTDPTHGQDVSHVLDRFTALRDDFWARPGWSDAGDAVDALLDQLRADEASRPTHGQDGQGDTPGGLYIKFRVARVDGRDQPGGDKTNARYFVLDYVNDPYARTALFAYAIACAVELPGLSDDLMRQLGAPEEAPR